MSDEEGIIMPGSFIGLLGGGQLARMLILAGHPLGFRFVVLDPDSEAPASQVGARHMAGKTCRPSPEQPTAPNGTASSE